MNFEKRNDNRMIRIIIKVVFLFFAYLIFAIPSNGFTANVSEVPFWDGETVDPSGLLLNRFGGNPVNGIFATVQHSDTVKRTGNGAFRIDTNRTIPVNDFDFIGTALTGFGPTKDYVDTRDITNFDEVRFWLRNDTKAPFILTFEIKDYRDSNDHRARISFTISSEGLIWQPILVSLPTQVTGSGWTIIGNPDFSRCKLFALVIEAKHNAEIDGSIYIDDMILIENGGDLDPATSPIAKLVDRIAMRQFRGLWGSRDQNVGLVPSISSFADVLALNTTAGLILVLPTAISLAWVNQDAADTFISQVISTLNDVMDSVIASSNGGFLPPRYIDRVSLQPSFVLEESSVDAAFIFLALYKYMILDQTKDSLKVDINQFLRRFNFKAFESPTGWKLAYLYNDGNFTGGTYDGYSGEVWVISLAAHLQSNMSYHVDIATLYHSATHRVLDYLVKPDRKHLVHEFTQFRAPFLQWLFPLFVDVVGRGKDNYPIRNLASNPFENAVLYQLEVHEKSIQTGREKFLQPDAGDDGTGNNYEQFSYYNDFGQPDLFMPWSVAFSFLADPKGAELAFRNHLSEGLHGPLGLSDAVRWPTKKSHPELVTARHDFWNLALSTMALMQYRYGGNQVLASDNKVSSALDKVFKNPPLIAPVFQLLFD